jgi:hypothetical protein
MTLMIGLSTSFFLEMSKKCWPRFRVRNSTYWQLKLITALEKIFVIVLKRK